ncbi:MAG TPA: hypothetical protein VE033_13870 [Acetobacteraceae bacterium]|nr:hypothetical protein [Acetobacteraceae bacterium]
MKLSLIAALGLLATFPAAAQDRPPAMPTRDVAVTYKVEDSPPTVDSVAWLAAEGRIRMEGRALTQRMVHLIDTRGGGVTVVSERDRNYHELGRVAEVMTQDHVLVRPNVKLAREGADTVAGVACTVWRIEAPDAAPEDARRACITADGVPLRLVEGTGSDANTIYLATRVTYGPQDPARFRVPAGYAPLEVPGQPRRR